MSYYIQFILKRKRIGLHLLEGGVLKKFWKMFLKAPQVEILLCSFTPATYNLAACKPACSYFNFV